MGSDGNAFILDPTIRFGGLLKEQFHLKDIKVCGLLIDSRGTILSLVNK